VTPLDEQFDDAQALLDETIEHLARLQSELKTCGCGCATSAASYDLNAAVRRYRRVCSVLKEQVRGAQAAASRAHALKRLGRKKAAG